MVTLLGHKVWNLVISHFLRISYPNFAACQHSLMYVQQCQNHENVEWVTKFTSNIFRLSKYSMIFFESCLFLYCRAALQSLCCSLLNCWNSSLIPAHTGFNRSQGTCCTLVIHHKPGGTHIYCTIMPSPPPHPHPTPTPTSSVRGHYFNSWTGRTQFPTCSKLMNPLKMSIWSMNCILGRAVPLLLVDSYVRAF